MESCENEVVSRAFEQTKHIIQDDYNESITILKRIAFKELNDFHLASKVFSEKLSDAVEKLIKAFQEMSKSMFQTHILFNLCDNNIWSAILYHFIVISDMLQTHFGSSLSRRWAIFGTH